MADWTFLRVSLWVCGTCVGLGYKGLQGGGAIIGKYHNDKISDTQVAAGSHMFWLCPHFTNLLRWILLSRRARPQYCHYFGGHHRASQKKVLFGNQNEQRQVGNGRGRGAAVNPALSTNFLVPPPALIPNLLKRAPTDHFDFRRMLFFGTSCRFKPSKLFIITLPSTYLLGKFCMASGTISHIYDFQAVVLMPGHRCEHLKYL